MNEKADNRMFDFCVLSALRLSVSFSVLTIMV